MIAVALITVQHTGTSSVRKLLRNAGYREQRFDGRCKKDKKGVLYRGHVFNSGVAGCRWQTPLITTSRPWEDVEESWVRRYGKLKKRHGNDKNSFGWQRKFWEEHVEPFASVVIHIYNPAKALAKLEALLGIELPEELPWENKS